MVTGPMTDRLFDAKVFNNELEADFQFRVMEVFGYNGWLVYSIPDSRRASLAGWPDLTIIKGDVMFWAELKRDKGRLSESQKLLHPKLERIHPVYVWRPSDWDEIVRIARGK